MDRGRHVVNVRRSLALLFGLALLMPALLPADPCAPVCDCCPYCTAQDPRPAAPCHSPTSNTRRDCTDCLKAAPTLPEGLPQAGPVFAVPEIGRASCRERV